MLRDRKWLDAVRECRCLATGKRASAHQAVDPAHIGTAGKGIKSADNEVIPLRHHIHQDCHQFGEVSTLRLVLRDEVLVRMAHALEAIDGLHGLATDPASIRDWPVEHFLAALRAYARQEYTLWANGLRPFVVGALSNPATKTVETS